MIVNANKFYGGKVDVVCCSTFRQLVKITEDNKECDTGIMAIENSIAGSILPNYNLLQKSKLKIIGEIYLHIRQNLLVNPGVKLEEIHEVHSHPMAIQQCFEFLDKYNWKIVETDDTALSAKHIHQHHSKHIAAIASRLAADIYQLKVIAPNIHTLKKNYTRFLILQRAEEVKVTEGNDKASINFHTDHTKGSLAKVLIIISDAGINLSKLQSMPIPGSDFKYSFHADLEFKTKDQLKEAMEGIKEKTEDLQILGIYKNGRSK